MKTLSNEQANVWASYYNSKVVVLYKNDVIHTILNSLNKKIVVYYFEDESIPEGYEKRVFLFEDFIREVTKSGNFYFGHASNDINEWYWHINAYTSFTKEALDNFLLDNSATKEYKEKYNFLFENHKK